MEPERNLLFSVPQMDCMEEVGLIRQSLATLLPDDSRLRFDIPQRTVQIDLSETDLTAAQVQTALQQSGLKIELRTGKSPDLELLPSSPRWRREDLWTMLSGLGLLIVLIVSAIPRTQSGDSPIPGLDLIEMLGVVLAIATGLKTVLPKAIRSVLRLQPDMNLLLVLATVGALSLRDWTEAASIVFLFAVANSLEAWSVSQAQRAIDRVLQLTPPVTQRLTDGDTPQTVPVAEVHVGERIRIGPGERIPLDGIILTGESLLDQSTLTGESVPVLKRIGDPVFAGTVNGAAALELRVTSDIHTSTVAQVAELVQQAQSRRSARERWVDRFARWYTPLILAASLLLVLIPAILVPDQWTVWLYRGLVLLVIGCPCALVISTPVSIVAGLACAARHGVLLKGGTALERAAGLRAVAFDKTGTLTTGRLTVQQVIPSGGHSAEELLRVAASVEAVSSHPLAKAIVTYASEQQLALLPATDLREIAGLGAEANIEGVSSWAGSAKLLQQRIVATMGENRPAEVNHPLPDAGPQESRANGAKSVVYVGQGADLLGRILLRDEIRPTALAAMEQLRALGMTHLCVLTGDLKSTAESIAQELRLTEVHAELLPADKLRIVRELVEATGATAMVGDGINDAPALAEASLGIAMGQSASDIAIATADVAMLTTDLTRLPWLVRHARRTLQVIQQNIAFALLVKAVFAVLAVMGATTLWGAIAADTGASIVVIFNGLRLLSDPQSVPQPRS